MSECNHCGRKLSTDNGVVLPCYPCSLESKPSGGEPKVTDADWRREHLLSELKLIGVYPDEQGGLCNERAEKAEAELARVRAGGWRDCRQELPQDGQLVLVTDGNFYSVETYPYQLARMMGSPPAEQFDCPATHWQPIQALKDTPNGE
jgi:hypothetical protein